MPSVAEIDSIETTLKASLGRGKELDQNVASSAQRLLSQKIEFVPAGKPLALELRSGYGRRLKRDVLYEASDKRLGIGSLLLEVSY